MPLTGLRRRFAWSCLLLGLVVACGDKKAREHARPGPLSLDPALPGSAAAVAVLESPLRGLELLFSMGGFDQTHSQALRAEVDAYLQKRLGVSLNAVQRLSVFFIPPEDGAVIVRGITGTWKGARPGEAVPVDGQVVAATQGDALVVGTPAAVSAALGAAAGTSPRLAAGRPALAALLEKESNGATLLVAADAAAVTDPAMRAQVVETFELERGVLVVGGSTTIRAVLTGKDGGLNKLSALIMLGMGTAVQAAETERKRLTDDPGGDVLEAVAAIAAAHASKYWYERLKPRVEAGRMVIEAPFELESTTMLVPAIGVLAAVAIPSFIQYIRRSKATEATANLAQLHQLVRLKAIPPRGSIGPTPPLGSCCREGRERCEADPALWQTPLWRELGFAVETNHYYSYSYASDGRDFTVRAQGDLDCDGVYSTFEMTGQGSELARTEELE